MLLWASHYCIIVYSNISYCSIDIPKACNNVGHAFWPLPLLTCVSVLPSTLSVPISLITVVQTLHLSLLHYWWGEPCETSHPGCCSPTNGLVLTQYRMLCKKIQCNLIYPMLVLKSHFFSLTFIVIEFNSAEMIYKKIYRKTFDQIHCFFLMSDFKHF